jgi:hypothetical protein
MIATIRDPSQLWKSILVVEEAETFSVVSKECKIVFIFPFLFNQIILGTLALTVKQI